MNYLEIESVVGREILDSRGNPTVEASYETGWIRGHRSRGIGLVEESEKRDRHAGIYRGSD